MAKEKKSILRALVRWVLRVIFVLLIALLCFSSAVRPREAANGPLAGYTYLRNSFTLTVTLVHYHGEESSVTVPAACRLPPAWRSLSREDICAVAVSWQSGDRIRPV